MLIADSGGTILNTMDVTAGQFYPVPIKFKDYLAVTVGGTLDVTLFHAA